MTFPVEKAVELAVKIDGWMDRDELAWLYNMASKIPEGGHWVEVGVWKGRSFMATALGLSNNSTIHGVDSFSGDDVSEAHWEAREIKGWIRDHFLIAVMAIQSIRAEEINVKLMQGRSVPMARIFQHLPAQSVVFLDALHDYDSVMADLEAWRPLIKKGGMIAGHDIDREGVEKAVKELLPNYQRGPKNIWYCNI